MVERRLAAILAAPDLTSEKYRSVLLFQDGPHLDRFLGALKQAGMPGEADTTQTAGQQESS